MTETCSSWRLREIIEDRLDALTGEPRHVTDIEVEFFPEQDNTQNWSAHATCKPEYAAALESVMDQLETEFPVISFD
jgi:hypothetical protein